MNWLLEIFQSPYFKFLNCSKSIAVFFPQVQDPRKDHALYSVVLSIYSPLIQKKKKNLSLFVSYHWHILKVWASYSQDVP